MRSRFLSLPVLGIVVVVASCRTTTTELLVAISRGGPEDRQEAIVKLGELLAEKEAAGFPFAEGDIEAMELLEDIAAQDPDPTNQMRAIASLARLEQFDLTDVHLQALDSPHWGVRWEGAKALTAHPDPRAGPRLAEQVRKERRDVVLLDLVKALAALGDDLALQSLLEVYLERSERFETNRLKAYRAILELSGRDFAFEDAMSWRQYYEERFATPDAAGAAPPAGQPAPTAGQTAPEGAAGQGTAEGAAGQAAREGAGGQGTAEGAAREGAAGGGEP